MTKDDFLSNYESALTELAIAKVKVKLLKTKLKFHVHGAIPQTNSKDNTPKDIRNRVQQFIESHPDLEPEDIEFLKLGECTVADVTKYLNDNSIIEIHRDTVGRKIGTWYRPGPSDSPGKRTIDPISVFER